MANIPNAGRPGGQLWIQPLGFYHPKTLFSAKKIPDTGKHVAEWRAGDGSHSVVWGQHPDGMRYSCRCDVSVKEICFRDLKWSADLGFKWPEERPRPAGWAGSPVKFSDSPVFLERRIRGYINTVDIAVDGQGGSNPTFQLACRLVNDWAITDPQEVTRWMLYYSSTRCDPPWSEKEIEHKVRQAFAKLGQGELARPYGCLRNAPDPNRPEPEPSSPWSEEELEAIQAKIAADQQEVEDRHFGFRRPFSLVNNQKKSLTAADAERPGNYAK